MKDLEVPLRIEEEVLRLEVSVGHTLTVQIRHAAQYLLEAALDLAGRHSALFDGSVQITTRTELHHLAPVLALVLDKVDSLHNIDVVQRRRYTKLGCELFDVLLLGLVLAALSELLVDHERGKRNKYDKRLTLTAYSFSSLLSHLCARRTTEVAPLPIAIFWQTPYFCDRLAVLSPAVDRGPCRPPASLSPSDLRLLPPVERWEDLRASLGPLASRSLSVNLVPPPSCE